MLAVLASLVSVAVLAAPPNLSQLVRTLRAEAEAIRDGDRTLPRRADLAERAPEPPAAEALARAIAQPTDADPFVDAYVRWQLTAYSSTHLPESARATPRGFARVLERLPALPPNPEADEALLRDLAGLADAEALDARDQEELNRRLDAIAARASRARALAAPALGIRTWLQRETAADAPRAALARLEGLAALMAGGWSCEREKEELERWLAPRKAEFDAEARETFARAARRLVGPGHLFVRDVRLDAGTIEVIYGTTVVDDFECRRWVRIITPERP